MREKSLEEFVARWMKGRVNWWAVPRLGVTNFGSIISMVLYRQAPFQVELFIVPNAPSSFPNHKHPHVDSYEFPLSGDHTLFFDNKPLYNQYNMTRWVNNEVDSPPVHIKPDQYHSGEGRTPYAFLSIQKWLDGVVPTSVGLDWYGEASSEVHEELWRKVGNSG